jgi:hypothetical protein
MRQASTPSALRRRRLIVRSLLALALMLGGAAIANSAADEVAPGASNPPGAASSTQAAPSAPAPSAADGAPSPPPAAADGSASSGRYDRRLELPSTPAYFDDANRLPPMIPIQVPQPQPRNSRSMVWIGGLLVLVAVFLWNRGRRLELERMETATARDARDDGSGGEVIDISSARSPAPPIDEDADDLAAAAHTEPSPDSSEAPSAASRRSKDTEDAAEDTKEEPR